MNELKSKFAARINDMLEFREAIGFKAETHMAYLSKFDAFCHECYPSSNKLSEPVVLAWAASEHGGSTGAAHAVRALGHYLQAMGEAAYILPEGFSSGKSSFNAYVFTDSELAALFRAVDNIQATTSAPYIGLIAPVMFRLTYTCGLRPNESRELLIENVDLDTGEVFITKTKKHRERTVVMSDDMIEMCRRYEQQRRLFAEDSPFFFPSPQGSAYAAASIDRFFKSCWVKANPGIPKNELPAVSVYSLRHRFASARLNLWLDQKRDLMVMLPYLRAYMGHLRMEDTAYYIHLLPENIVKSAAIDWSSLDDLLPEVTPC
jgi:integrase